MKTVIRLSIFLFIAVSFTACVKSVEVTTVTPSNTLTGSWQMADAAVNSGSGWVSFDPGYNGVFSFYDNGTAQYYDANTTMQGNYFLNTVTTGYYDVNGNYSVDLHQTFEIQVSNNSGAIDLYFDDISFAGNNQFIATYFDGKNINRYTFLRD